MANYIEYAKNLVPDLYVVPTSRYLNSKVIYYGNQKKMTFNTYKRQDFTESQDDKFMLVTAGYEYRPDLVSQKVYFTPDYWWRIMEANNISDILDFRSGITVRLPINFSIPSRRTYA
jgi:hypothetical protein